MAFSIYAYLKPEILESEILWFREYFSSRPWAAKVDDSDGLVFVYVKPRYETFGEERVKPFLHALKTAQFQNLLDRIVQDDTRDALEIEHYCKVAGTESLLPLLRKE